MLELVCSVARGARAFPAWLELLVPRFRLAAIRLGILEPRARILPAGLCSTCLRRKLGGVRQRRTQALDLVTQLVAAGACAVLRNAQTLVAKHLPQEARALRG